MDGAKQPQDPGQRCAGWRGGTVQVRVPLIPGITDTAENLGSIFQFLRASGLPRVCLLPYNPSSGAKYEWLGLDYGIEAERQGEGQIAGMLEMARAAGLEAVAG